MCHIPQGLAGMNVCLGLVPASIEHECFHCSLVVHTKCGQWAGIFHIQLQILWDPKFLEILEI